MHVATAEVDITPKTDGLIRVIRIIEKHLGALASELEQTAREAPADQDSMDAQTRAEADEIGRTLGTTVHQPGARPPRY